MNSSPAVSKVLLLKDQQTPASRSAADPVRRFRIARLQFGSASHRPVALTGHTK